MDSPPPPTPQGKTLPIRTLISTVEHMLALEPGTTPGQISVSGLLGQQLGM